MNYYLYLAKTVKFRYTNLSLAYINSFFGQNDVSYDYI